ncbi:hypothetical protein LshimejAT787_0506720 [Lyophyllum shimeji]|uniref:Uncharacterized protein n=1 Tax=Lyophyllum shimeji TaxID=47721 RepID=A0A9P3PP18_LYOSH|nr:hypothetical protein LshimejAT787_0506720 [Lyophyllum shimeji]
MGNRQSGPTGGYYRRGSVDAQRNGMGYPHSIPEGAIGIPYADANMFFGAEDTVIEGGELAATRSMVTYRHGDAPVPEQGFGGGTADMFSGARGTVIRGGKITAAGSIIAYDGPAQQAATQQHSTRYASSHEATPQTVPSGSRVPGGRPAARPGVPDPPPKDSKYTQPQYVYSHTASHTGRGTRVRR